MNSNSTEYRKRLHLEWLSIIRDNGFEEAVKLYSARNKKSKAKSRRFLNRLTKKETVVQVEPEEAPPSKPIRQWKIGDTALTKYGEHVRVFKLIPERNVFLGDLGNSEGYKVYTYDGECEDDKRYSIDMDTVKSDGELVSKVTEFDDDSTITVGVITETLMLTPAELNAVKAFLKSLRS